jgi:hypothetical protein
MLSNSTKIDRLRTANSTTLDDAGVIVALLAGAVARKANYACQ